MGEESASETSDHIQSPLQYLHVAERKDDQAEIIEPQEPDMKMFTLHDLGTGVIVKTRENLGFECMEYRS
jgi:hypothetical protein